MSNFRNVTKKERCPICGKPDWCSIQATNETEELNYCRRELNNSNIISPVNGQTYIFIKQTRDGSCCYEKEQMRTTAIEEWRIEHKYNKTNPYYTKEKTFPSSIKTKPKEETQIMPFNRRQLNQIYRFFLLKLRINHNHMDYLKKEGWTSQLIEKSQIRSLPSFEQRINITRDLIMKFGSLERVPGFYLDKHGCWTFSGSSGVLIPLLDYKENMYRLRIRLDHPEKDDNGKEKSKYRNFSSYYTSSRKTYCCSAGNHIGFYANPTFDDFKTAFITEGEKKAIFSNNVLHHPVISLPGVNSFQKLLERDDEGMHVLDFLRYKKCKTLVIAFDSDKFQKPEVLKYEKILLNLLLNQGFELVIAEWNQSFGKGIDDILSIGKMPQYNIVVNQPLDSQLPL